MNKKSRLRSKADKLAYEKYLQKECEVCSKPAIQLHHYIPKGLSLALRYDPKNLISLCMSCHFKLHTQQDPAIHEAIRKKRGKKWWDYLKNRREKRQTLTVKWLEDIIKKLSKVAKK